MPGARAQGADTPDDALHSLARLEALGRGESPAGSPVKTSPPRRPRVEATSRRAQPWARIAAPVAFLVAVIIVVSLAFQSGIVGGGTDRPTKPAVKPSKVGSRSPRPTSSVARTSSTPVTSVDARAYTVRTGDSLSGIAARFDVTVAEIEELNADRDLTTLHPGQTLNIPPK